MQNRGFVNRKESRNVVGIIFVTFRANNFGIKKAET